jgi:hypothetical protein
MKFTVAIIAVSAILSMAVLGPFAMAHTAEHSGHCPIAMLSGSSCLSLASIFGHLNTIAGVLQGVAQQSVVIVIALGAVIMAVALLVRDDLLYIALSRVERDRRSAVSVSFRNVIRWCSLLEHSPTVA